MRAIGNRRVTPLSELASTTIVPQPLSSPTAPSAPPTPASPLPRLAPRPPSPMEPRRYGGKVAWTTNDDQLLLAAHAQRSTVVYEQEPEARGGKGPRLTALDWDAIADEVKEKGGNARSGGAHKARWKIIESGGRNRGDKQPSELGARSRKRSIDDAYDWYEGTPSKRRASVGSTSPVVSEGMASATRSSSNAGIEQEQDPDYSPPLPPQRRASSPSTFQQEDTLGKRPWLPTEDSRLIALKTGATTKHYSYAQLAEDFPGRGSAAVAARWGKIRGKRETQKEIGANKRRARDEARDRRIQATLTGPPRLTWAVFERRMREKSGMNTDLAESSDEEDDGEDEETVSNGLNSRVSVALQQSQPPNRPAQLVTRIDQLLNKDDEEAPSPIRFEAPEPTVKPSRPAPPPPPQSQPHSQLQPLREPVFAEQAAAALHQPYAAPRLQLPSAPNASTDSQRRFPPPFVPPDYRVSRPVTRSYVPPPTTSNVQAPFPLLAPPCAPFPGPTPNPPVWPSLPALARQESQFAPNPTQAPRNGASAASTPQGRRKPPTFAEVWTGRAGLR